MTSRWRFVLHGGCGETCPDAQRQQEISRDLNNVAEMVAKALAEGTRARDAVTLAVSALEDCPVFNAGYGAALNRQGVHQLEAGIADGSSARYAAIGCARTIKNPIAVANALLERSSHGMLVCRRADEAAKDFGFEAVPNSYFTTPFRKAYWDRTVRAEQQDVDSEMGAVGAIILDSHGALAAGGSTGGPTGKFNGRIGDTAILGTGLYADLQLGVLCSGAGDQILKRSVANKVAEYHALGNTLSDATRKAFHYVCAAGVSCSLVAINAEGNMAVESASRLFSVAWGSSSEAPMTRLWPTTLPVLPSHEFYNDDQLLIGLSRYPTTLGHALVVIKSVPDLFSLSPDEFIHVMTNVSTAASFLRKRYRVKRCALVAEGGNLLSIIPLHGLSKDWHPITSDSKEFHESFPGYISSKEGPKMEASRLDEICCKIQTISGSSAPFNYGFQGTEDDTNQFAGIVRGDLQQWRVWEDDNHVACLTPFANTPGFTVLVPRKHLPSDIFSIERQSFNELMVAAHCVAGHLKRAFKTSRCGMIFEGFEIDYPHANLIPIHTMNAATSTSATGKPTVMVAPFQDVYQGYVSSLNGPLWKSSESLARTALGIRKAFNLETVRPYP